MAPLPGMSLCGRDVPPFFHSCMWEPPAVQGRHSCRPRACVVALLGGRHVRSVAFVPPACAPSCLVGVCLTASVPGVINGAPTGYVTVRSRCPVVFSSVRVGTAVSVGATFMSPACVRHCVACAPSCLVGVCLTAPVPGVINGAPTGYAAVRSWCPAVFSSVRVGTAVSVGATFMSPACVRCRGLAVCVSPFRRRAS